MCVCWVTEEGAGVLVVCWREIQLKVGVHNSHGVSS